ncbi:MAG: MFS transporter, partial [Bacteroidota bacterium]
NTLTSILTIRFFTGFFLAGIYPVGMKIAAGFFEKGLGKSLGFLVGALVVGTALPHLLKEATATFSWTYVLLITSTLAALGGVLMVALVPDGPFRKPSQQLQLSAFYSIFKKRSFRSAAFGYFGHMWELYAFWAFVPVMLQSYARTHPEVSFNVPLLSFLIIGIGGLSCVLAGYLAQAYGAKRVASSALCLSGLCCLLSPVLFASSSAMLFVSFLLFWGMVVIADSPLFSTLVAQHAPPALKGTALTIVNCVGFAITILSIQLLTQLSTVSDTLLLYVVLAIGLVLGLVALWGRELFAGK